jgi:MFS superfamily sulfate permease-like transporter
MSQTYETTREPAGRSAGNFSRNFRFGPGCKKRVTTVAVRTSAAYMSPSLAPGTTHFGDRERHQENESVPGALVVRCESALLYFNAEFVRERLLELLSVRPDDKAIARRRFVKERY